MAGREKRCLGDFFGLTNFGVNLTKLLPGACSALRHAHSKQDEFIYILSGHPVLITDTGETELSPGMCARFKAGTGDAHQLLQYDHNANHIVHFSKWSSLENARSFFESPELVAIRKKAGVKAPEFIYLQEIEGGLL